jgi:hypothetical protein
MCDKMQIMIRLESCLKNYEIRCISKKEKLYCLSGKILCSIPDPDASNRSRRNHSRDSDTPRKNLHVGSLDGYAKLLKCNELELWHALCWSDCYQRILAQATGVLEKAWGVLFLYLVEVKCGYAPNSDRG